MKPYTKAYIGTAICIAATTGLICGDASAVACGLALKKYVGREIGELELFISWQEGA